MAPPPGTLIRAQRAHMPISMILAGIAGNLYAVAAARIKLVDIILPKKLVKEFKGPKFGIKGLRDFLSVRDRPFVAAILKPKLGMSPKDISKVCYEAALGGADLIKDDHPSGYTLYGYPSFQGNRMAAEKIGSHVFLILTAIH